MIAGGRAFSFIAGVIALVVGLAHAGDRVSLSHRLNDIDSVQCDGTSVHFMGQDGTLTFETRTARWTIDTSKRYLFSTLDPEKYWERRDDSLSVWLGRNNFSLDTYTTGQLAVNHDDTLMALVATAGEGAVFSHQCIANTFERVAYCFPVHRIKAFDFDPHSIWLGSYQGAMHIERRTGKCADYLVLPFLDENCSIYRDVNHIWVAADGMGIQRVDLRTKLLTFWDINQLLEELHQRWKAHNSQYERPKGKAVFTNFESDGDDLFVACRFVDGGGFLVKQSSYLLTFSRSKQIWHAEWVSRTESRDADGVSMIRRFGQWLWLGCGHRTVWEGGGHKEFGGLFICARPFRPSPSRPEFGPRFDSDNRVLFINDMDVVHREHLVVAMAIDNGHMFVDTYEPSAGRRTTYKVNADATMTVFSDSLGFYDEYYQRIRHLPHRGSRALPDSLRRMLVAPVIRTIPADSVEVIRR